MINFKENNETAERISSRAILVGVTTGEDISYSMAELEGLAVAADVEVLGTLVQNVDKLNSATLIGSGKVKELAELCTSMEADLVIFNDELSGMQLRNVEDQVNVKVIDRTILILDIFAARASSAEGKLQVELAQLQYRMPRLIGFGKSLSRLGGGIGTRGPGEKKLETDRRHIQHRMDEIKRDINDLKANRGVQRAKREKSGIPVVALAGYTNSGKSSVMNYLLDRENRSDKQVFEKDMLFATLDTAQRLITLEDNRSFILIDTVGFVSRLPHALVDAFKATLEEVSRADLIVHVVDSSFENCDFHIDVTNSVLKELGAGDKPVILAFNKQDISGAFDTVGYGSNAIGISAKTGFNMDILLDMIKKEIFSDLETVKLLIPFSRGDLVSALNELTKPVSVEYTPEGTLITAELDSQARSRYGGFII